MERVDVELRDGVKAQSTAHARSKLCAGKVLRAETRVPQFLPLARLIDTGAKDNVFEKDRSVRFSLIETDTAIMYFLS